ncbi:MAG: sulfatase [Gemmatimonadetes bacterium]|nr:sulfatase [Gemmatimonadota bacterium]
MTGMGGKRIPGRLFLYGAVLLAGGLLAGFGCGLQREKPWNVLLITIDTLRADRLGCYGGMYAATPNMDRLAERGVLFANAFAAMPLTLPSHTSILTGLYPKSHGVLSHAYTLEEDKTTLAEYLHAEGYRTGAFISSHVLDNRYGIGQGFDTFWRRYNYNAEEANRIRASSGFDILTEAVGQYLAAPSEQPTFAWIHWFHPHKPYEPPQSQRLKYDYRGNTNLQADKLTLEQLWKGYIDLSEEDIQSIRGLYDGEVAYTDQQVGIILDQLEESGMAERTIVILTADHGEMLYERDRYFGHDIMLYDPSIQVPLIIAAPGLADGGRIVQSTVRSVDLVPTLLEMLAIATEDEFDGRTLTPVFDGEELSDVPVLAELFGPKPNWKTEPRHSVRYNGWKIIEEEGSDVRQLYWLADDPNELNNRAESDPEKYAEMKQLLDDVRAGSRDVDFPELSDEERKVLEALGYMGGD